MLKWCSRVALAVVLLAAGSGVSFGDDTRKSPDPSLDDELLEFLGSVDTAAGDDDEWSEYLSEADIGKVAAKPDSPTVVAAKPAAPSQPEKPSAPGAKQQNE
jgi:hypothetical protein